MAQKRIKRGEFVRLPNGAGSISIGKEGAVLYRPAAPAKKNPTATKRKRTAPKAKQPAGRVSKALAAFVRGELKKKRTKNPIGRPARAARRTARRTTRRRTK